MSLTENTTPATSHVMVTYDVQHMTALATEVSHVGRPLAPQPRHCSSPNLVVLRGQRARRVAGRSALRRDGFGGGEDGGNAGAGSHDDRPPERKSAPPLLHFAVLPQEHQHGYIFGGRAGELLLLLRVGRVRETTLLAVPSDVAAACDEQPCLALHSSVAGRPREVLQRCDVG